MTTKTAPAVHKAYTDDYATCGRKRGPRTTDLAAVTCTHCLDTLARNEAIGQRLANEKAVAFRRTLAW